MVTLDEDRQAGGCHEAPARFGAPDSPVLCDAGGTFSTITFQLLLRLLFYPGIGNHQPTTNSRKVIQTGHTISLYLCFFLD